MRRQESKSNDQNELFIEKSIKLFERFIYTFSMLWTFRFIIQFGLWDLCIFQACDYVQCAMFSWCIVLTAVVNWWRQRKLNAFTTKHKSHFIRFHLCTLFIRSWIMKLQGIQDPKSRMKIEMFYVRMCTQKSLFVATITAPSRAEHRNEFVLKPSIIIIIRINPHIRISPYNAYTEMRPWQRGK